MPISPSCSTTRAAPPTRSAGCSCTSSSKPGTDHLFRGEAQVVCPRLSSPMPFARACSSSTSGRTSPSIGRRSASTSRSRISRASAWRSARSPRREPTKNGRSSWRSNATARGRCSRAARRWAARCRDASGSKAAQSGSSFYYSFLFLPPERRRAITALYAFCREVDDIADEVSDLGIARTKLAWWRTEVANLFAGHPQHPVTKALAPFAPAYGIDAARLNEIIDGMEMDLTYHRYSDFDALKLYCHRVAAVTRQLSASSFPHLNPPTLAYPQPP